MTKRAMTEKMLLGNHAMAPEEIIPLLAQYNLIGQKVVSNEYVNRLKVLVCQSPRDYGYSNGRWTAQWLRTQLAKEFDIQISNYHITRLLKSMGLSMRKLSLSTLNHF